jgi:CheY-like chemotaxis protein
MAVEQRKQKRVVLRRHVLINDSIKAMGLDQSEGGLYIHTGRNFPVGSVIDVAVPLEEQPALTMKAQVRHSQENVGMGVMFLDLSPVQRQLLRNLIADLEGLGLKPGEDGKKRILLVDDNAANRRMYKSKLVLDGFTVHEAENGLAALDLLGKEKVDLVLLDLFMEGIDGFKLISIIREKAGWKDVPILVISARSSPADIERALGAGATEFIAKMTTSPAKLSDRVKAYLK